MKTLSFYTWVCVLTFFSGNPIRAADEFRLQFAPVHATTIANGHVFAREYTENGPVQGVRLIPGMKVIPTPGLDKFYGVFYHEFVEIDAASGGLKRITLPEELSWPTSIAYDLHLGRFLISANGPEGAGAIYAYDLEDRIFSRLPSTPGDHFDALVMDDEEGVLWGFTQGKQLIRMDRDGQQLGSRIDVPVPSPINFFPGMHQSELVNLGGGRLALLIDREFGWEFQPESSHQRIYILNQSGSSVQSFSRDFPEYPPINAKPVVRITSPAEGEEVNSPEEFLLKVEAVDPDGTVEQVTLYSGFNLLAEIERSGNGEFVFDRFKLPPGSYQLTAQARDNEGFMANSASVSFTIKDPNPVESSFHLSFWPVENLRLPTEGRIEHRVLTASGPVAAKTLFAGVPAVADSAEDPLYYATYWHEVYRLNPYTGKSEQMAVTGVPELSWPTAITYDGTQNRLLLTSLGGEGFLYAYSFADEVWSAVSSLRNNDYYALTTDWSDGSIYVLSNEEITRLDANGEEIDSMPTPPLPGSLTPGGYAAQLVVQGEHLYLLIEPGPLFHASSGGGIESRIYEIDFAAKTSRQTYRKVWRQWPPVNAVPSIELRAPTPGAILQSTNPIPLAATVNDLDNDVTLVEFLANQQIIGRGIKTGADGNTHTYTLEWRNARPGNYEITVRVTDSEGATALSTPVQITVAGEMPSPLFTMDFYRYGNVPTPVVTHSYSPEGPLNDPRLLPGLRLIREGGNYYRADSWDNSLLRINNETGLAESLLIEGVSPEVRVPVGLTFDRHRNRLVLATTGGEGFLYAYWIESNRWSVIGDLNDRDLVSLHHHADLDALFGLAVLGHNPSDGPTLFQFDAEGNEVGFISLPRLPYTLGQSGYRAEITDAGEFHVAVLMEFTNPGLNLVDESRLYIVDTRTGEYELTYHRIWNSYEIFFDSPVVKMISPQNGSEATLGEPTLLKAAAWAGQAGVVAFEFLVDGEVVEATNQDRDLSGVTFGELLWTPIRPGTNTLVARIRTSQGQVASSEPIIVIVLNRPADFIMATRNLPDFAAGGQPFVVRIEVEPGAGVHAYALEDSPPTGWEVSAISHEGVWDEGTGSVKFGPFFDNAVRTISYTVTPPTNTTDAMSFSGHVSANGNRQVIRGDTTVAVQPGFHPADRSPADFRIDLQELTAYGSAWKSGEFIPMNYVTRAAMIWRQGEWYRFDASVGEGPFWWVPVANSPLVQAAKVDGVLRRIRALGTGHYEIMIELPSIGGGSALALEEKLPSGATASRIMGGGSLNSSTIRWGPWLQEVPASVSYQLTTSNPLTSLRGTASIDGAVTAIIGATRIDAPVLSASVSSGTLRLKIEKPIGATVILEQALDLDGPWSIVPGVDSSVVVPDPTEQKRFYRLRLEVD